jgi:glycosyltransferase involved in cell wall biosynthesis
MKIGIIIPVYNRFNYVSKCLESLNKVKTSEDIQIYIINDGSTDENIDALLNSFKPQWAKVKILRSPINKGISNTIETGLLRLKYDGCNMFINLDSDTIVKPNFIDVLLDLKLRFKDNIVSGFNTQSADLRTKEIRHKTIREESDYVVKSTIGGINMVFTIEQCLSLIIPSLKTSGHWDWNVCRRHKNFIVSKPSVIQHIGINEGKHTENPDVAYDFD